MSAQAGDARAEQASSKAQASAASPLGVLAGYDGSPDAERALRWAAWEARARRTMLTVLSAGQADIDAVLAPGMRLARELAGEDRTRRLAATGSAAAALCAHSASAELIVVGARGSGRDSMPGMPIGSVSLQVAANATGPVIVVRSGGHATSGHTSLPIVVGLDGSPDSHAAAQFAVEEAALRHCHLIAVCALADSPGVLGAAGHIRQDAGQLMARHERENPELDIRCEMSAGSARSALLEASVGAQLVVVGARGLGGFTGMTMGSVGLAVTSYARSPVAVIRASGRARLRAS